MGPNTEEMLEILKKERIKIYELIEILSDIDSGIGIGEYPEIRERSYNRYFISECVRDLKRVHKTLFNILCDIEKEIRKQEEEV